MLHLGLQLVVVALVLAAGDVLFGLESEFRLSQAAVGVVSVLVSIVILAVSHVSCQEGGRLARDLATPPHSTIYMVTSIIYILTTTIVSTLSALVLCSLLYVDTVALTNPTWLILPILLLGLHPLVMTMVYTRMCGQESCEHRYAWGMFSAVTPVRFLMSESRTAGWYLLISQLVWLLSHSLAWLAYSVYSLLSDESDVVFRVWLPIIIPLLLLSPLVTSLHWSLSLAPMYHSTTAHPDMADTHRRLASFPPDWRQLSGSPLTPESLATAGWFYSCRRLTSSEATCYACGRQVVDWSNIKTPDMAHRMASDTCPLHVESKQETRDSESEAQTNVSCFAEFLFIATTLLFRIASLGLLLWVFMDQWTTVSGQLWTLVIIPPLYMLIIVMFNSTSYLLCHPSTNMTTLVWSLVSWLLPRPGKTDLSSARQLLTLNMAANTLLHAFLWAAMTASCLSCSLSVSAPALTSAGPAVVVLCILSLLSTFPYYHLTVRNQSRNYSAATKRSHSNPAFMVSTAL